MNIAIVDDRREDIETLHKLLVSCLQKVGNRNYSIDKYIETKKFIENVEKLKYDLIILDIYIDDTNGVELANIIRSKDKSVKLVFYTTSNEFAAESYDVGAAWYHNPYG